MKKVGNIEKAIVLNANSKTIEVDLKIKMYMSFNQSIFLTTLLKIIANLLTNVQKKH